MSAAFTSGDSNYDNGTPATNSITINKADATFTVTPYTVTYDGQPHTATISTITGVNGETGATVGVVDVSGTTHTAAGVYTTDSWSFTGTANYKSVGPTPITDKIDKAASTTVVTIGSGPFAYTGSAITPATVAVTGAGGLNLTPAADYADNINAGVATASYSYAGDDNHTASSDSKTFTIDKAASTTVVTIVGGPFTYTGAAQTPATVAVTGVGGLSLTRVASYSNNINAGTATASYTFAGDANHTGSSDSKTFTIGKAHLTVTAANKAKVYDGAPFTAYTASFTGFVNSEPAAVVGGTPSFSTTPVNPAVNPGNYTIVPAQGTLTAANYDFTSFVNGTLTIGYGTCAAGYGPGGVILQPINSDGTSVYSRKGGSTIPVKFTVCDAVGLPISNATAVFAGTGGTLTMLSAVRGTVDLVNEPGVSDIPDAAFRWSGDKWIFNMATSNLQAGTTYTFGINLSLGNVTFRVGVK